MKKDAAHLSRYPSLLKFAPIIDIFYATALLSLCNF